MIGLSAGVASARRNQVGASSVEKAVSLTWAAAAGSVFSVMFVSGSDRAVQLNCHILYLSLLSHILLINYIAG